MKICLREFSESFLGKTVLYKFFRKVHKVPYIGDFILKGLVDKIFFNYQFIVTLIKSAKSIAEQMETIGQSIDYHKVVETVKEEIVMNVHELEELQESVMNQYGELVSFIRTKMAAYSIVQFQKKEIDAFEHQGLINEKEKEEWIIKFDQRIAGIDKLRPKNAGVKVQRETTFVMEFPLFSSLREEQIMRLMDERQKEEFKKNSKGAF
jgi:hypothetical protein